MNTRLLVVLDIVINALHMYLTSVAKIDFFQKLIKKSVKRLVIFVLFLLVLLVSIWFSILALIFFYLTSSTHLTHMEAMLSILGINLFGLMALLIWFKYLKRQIISLRHSSGKVILAYMAKLIDSLCHKHSN